MSTALQRAKERYAVTPRKLDPVLERKARGDRGCLFDIGSGIGILSSLACLIASQAGLIAFGWTYAGIALWVGSYFMGARAQSRSGELRHAALTQGPLTPSVIVAVEDHLKQRSNKRSGRALVLFALLEEGDGFEISKLQRRVAGLLAGERPDHEALSDLRKVLGDEFCFDLVELTPAHFEALGVGAQARGAGPLYLTRVVVDPEQVAGDGLDAGDELAIIVHLESGIAEAV